MPFPNFLLLGPHKTGSTSLHHYLSLHPEIFMSPIKEPGFFHVEGEEVHPFRLERGMVGYTYTELDDYLSLFDGVVNEVAIGEASVNYFNSEKATRRIKHYIPNVKMIVMLRNPVDRTYSHFLMSKRLGYELAPDLATAIRWERMEKNKNWIKGCPWGRGYLGFNYSDNLKRYLNAFDRSQFLFLRYDEFKKSNQGALVKIFDFLGVDPGFVPDINKQYNKSSDIRSTVINRFVNFPGWAKPIIRICPYAIRKPIREGVKRVLRNSPPELDADLRKELMDHFYEDIYETQRLVGIDLSDWFESETKIEKVEI